MQIIGIICEYNPFHNGHLYHLNKIKEKFPQSLIILVLNGYFLERGEVSIISKENKTKLALLNGIDLVMELPFVFGTQSADTFAEKSIQILAELKCDYVIFGSESNNLDILTKISNYTYLENETYQQEIKKYLNMGYNYPTSLAKALNIDFTFKPNDLLGISYLKAIKKHNYKITPLLIKRTNDYLDTNLDSDIVSASNIRKKLALEENINKYVPESTLKYLENISLDNLFPYLKYKIITDNNLSSYLDVDEGINYRLKKVINDTNTLDELILKIKSKRYTYNKINRMLIHILIGFTKEDNQKISLDYLRVLGFNEKGKKYLNQIKNNINITLITSKNSLVYKYELISALVYDLISKNNVYEFEKRNAPIYYKK